VKALPEDFPIQVALKDSHGPGVGFLRECQDLRLHGTGESLVDPNNLNCIMWLTTLEREDLVAIRDGEGRWEGGRSMEFPLPCFKMVEQPTPGAFIS